MNILAQLNPRPIDRVHSLPLNALTMPLPSENEFRAALNAYREKWPGDGYRGTSYRYIETYKYIRRHYVGGTVVDIGSWPGDLVFTLASLSIPVIAVDKDVSRSTSKEFDAGTGKYRLGTGATLQGKCDHYGLRAVQCDIERERLGLDDGSIDFMLATEVLEHLRVGLLHALAEMRRVLKPGGKLLITTPNLLSVRNRVSFFSGRVDYDTLEMPYDALAAEARIGHGGHFRVFSMTELVDLLERSDFEIVTQGYHQLPAENDRKMPRSIYDLRVRTCEILGRAIRPLGNALFVVAARK